MIGLGTIINTLLIVSGGLIGLFSTKLFKEGMADALQKVCGVSVIFISIAGAMEGMLKIDGISLKSTNALLVVISITLGTFIGELCGIEKGFEKFGEWLKIKTGNLKDQNFVSAFVTASLTVSVGAMAIVGSIQDGVSGNYTTLVIKGVLDFVIVLVLASFLGKGAIFSFIPVFVFEGLLTLLAHLIAPVLTDKAILYISFVGSILIFSVGINLVFGKKIRVANMLPSLIIVLVAAYL